MSTNLSAAVVEMRTYAVTPVRQHRTRRSCVQSSSRRELAVLMRLAQDLGAADYIEELWDIAGRPADEQQRRLAWVRRDMLEDFGTVA